MTPPSPVNGKIRIYVDKTGVYRTTGPSSLPYLPAPGATISSTTPIQATVKTIEGKKPLVFPKIISLKLFYFSAIA